jgi:hypothetical protein
MICVVITCFFGNPSIFGFAPPYSSLSWESSRFFRFVLRFDLFFDIL